MRSLVSVVNGKGLRSLLSLSCSRSFSIFTSPEDFLKSQNIDPSLVPGVLNSMQEFLGKPPTIESLEKFGTPGIMALAKAVEREMEEERRLEDMQTVTIHIHTSTGAKMKYEAKETETIKSIVDRIPVMDYCEMIREIDILTVSVLDLFRLSQLFSSTLLLTFL